MGELKNSDWFMELSWGKGEDKQVISAGTRRLSGEDREKISFRGKEGPILLLGKIWMKTSKKT